MRRATRAVWWLDNGAGGLTPVRCGWWLHDDHGRRRWRPWRPRHLRRRPEPPPRAVPVRRSPPMSAQRMRFVNDVHAAITPARQEDR